MDPVSALKRAVDALQLPVGYKQTSAQASAGAAETYSIFGASGTVNDPEARLVYFQSPSGKIELAWRIETDIMSNWLLSYVNANTNEEIMGVVDWSADAAVYEV